MTDLAQHRRHRAPVLAVVIFLIDQKCGGGNNHYYSERSHSKLPRYLAIFGARLRSGGSRYQGLVRPAMTLLAPPVSPDLPRRVKRQL